MCFTLHALFRSPQSLTATRIQAFKVLYFTLHALARMGGTLNAFAKKRLVITNLSYFVMMHKKAPRRGQGSTRGIYSFPRELFFPDGWILFPPACLFPTWEDDSYNVHSRPNVYCNIQLRLKFTANRATTRIGSHFFASTTHPTHPCTGSK